MNNQYNYITSKDYEGINQIELLNSKQKNNFQSDAWLTFLQARDKKLKIKAGSKSVAIFKGFGKVEEKDKENKLKVRSVPMGFARVFNIDQTEKANF